MSKSIADKISRIVALADSTTHPEEAASFMAKAHKLMEDHGISLLDLGRLDSDDPVGQETMSGNNANDNWRWLLGAWVGEYYGCHVVRTRWKTNNFTWTSFGRDSARITFTLMWPYVDRQVMALARREVKSGKYKSIPIARSRIAHAMVRRVVEMCRDKKETRKGTGLNQLVPVDVIELAVNEAFPDLAKGKELKLKYDENAAKVAKEVNLELQTGAAADALAITKA